jgi:hypothetical protein
MKTLNSDYGMIVILNLIDRKRVQKKIGEFFEEIVKSSSLVNKEKDFHFNSHIERKLQIFLVRFEQGM